MDHFFMSGLSHPNCRKCNSEKLSQNMQELYDDGLTFEWQPTGETREVNRWFRRGTKIQRKEVKIATPPEMMPMGVYRWKTIS